MIVADEWMYPIFISSFKYFGNLLFTTLVSFRDGQKQDKSMCTNNCRKRNKDFFGIIWNVEGDISVYGGVGH